MTNLSSALKACGRYLSPPQRWLRWRRRTITIGIASILLLFGGWLALPLVPLPAELFVEPVPDTELTDRNGELLRTVRAAGPHQDRVEYAEIPVDLVRATLAAEDRRFWKHSGVDWRGSLRAGWQLLRHRRVISGGSTISQQLIKLSAPRPRTLRTKLIEATQALRLEQLWSKQRILAEYLNRIEYGNFNRGCSAAGEFYFGKPLKDLTAAECALLAGLPQAPTRLNPHLHLDRAVRRQRWVLGQMLRNEWLSADDYSRAVSEKLRLAEPRRVFEAPHFVDLVLSTQRANQPERAVRTTLDLPLNRFTEQTLRRHLEGLRTRQVSNGAVVILENRTGDVLALVGSENYFSPLSGQVNGAWAARSAGSTFKPFTYLIALERGATTATIVADVPTEFATVTGLFAPQNYDRRCYGPMRYRLALANSLNISAVKVLASVGGAEVLLQRLRACGLTTLTSDATTYGLGLTIGNAEARLLELANAYASLARLGIHKPYRLLRDSPPAPEGAVSNPDAAYLVADMLSDNAARSIAFGPESPLRFPFPVACKTGTSSDFRDNWAFGYTPEFTVGVWVGNFDGSPMRQVSGVTGAAPILHDIFEHLHERYGTSWYQAPKNVTECCVHAVTGKRIRPENLSIIDEKVSEKFIYSTLPPFESDSDYIGTQVRLGDEYRDWLAGPDNWLGQAAVREPEPKTLRIVFPLPGTILYLDPDLADQGRRLSLKAEGSTNLQWHCASLELFQTNGRMGVLLSQGTHTICVTDHTLGLEDRTWIEVRQR